MSGVPLYELIGQFRELKLLADEPEVDPQTLADTLEGLSGDIEAKSEAVAMVIGNIEADADAIDEAAKQMAARAKRLRHRVESLKTYLLINMQACGFTKISCKWFTISLRKNPPRIDVFDAEAIPEKFRVWPEPPPPAIDRRALLDALKAGENIPGAQIAQDERVEIRV
jgi:hypothetical protein